jgi:primary-amine oxidase
MQSAGEEGISSWIRGRQEKGEETAVRNEDIVLWHSFGTTHNPRVAVRPKKQRLHSLITWRPRNFLPKKCTT